MTLLSFRLRNFREYLVSTPFEHAHFQSCSKSPCVMRGEEPGPACLREDAKYLRFAAHYPERDGKAILRVLGWRGRPVPEIQYSGSLVSSAGEGVEVFSWKR